MLEFNGETLLITGARGLVGSETARQAAGLPLRLLTPASADLDLTERQAVMDYFSDHRPDFVFMIAAKVGGIGANVADPVGFMADNARMTLNLFEACHRFGTRRNLFLGSSCIYPRECPQPMKEEYLLQGPFEPTNEGYALAKVMGLKLARYYHDQYGMHTVCPMPCNIYGTGDSFDLERAHVLSALVRRFVDAVDQDLSSVTLWGTGSARREFIHVADAVRALLFLFQRYTVPDIINVGPGDDISIRDLAGRIAMAAGFEGNIEWDATKPDGMPRKCLDVSELNRSGFRPRISLDQGIRQTIEEYRALKASGEDAA